MKRFWTLGFLSALCAILGCSEVATEEAPCEVGQTQACTCNNQQGTQTCVSSGNQIFFSECTACALTDADAQGMTDPNEPNDSATDATQIVVMGDELRVAGDISSPEDQDWFAFSLAAGATIVGVITMDQDFLEFWVCDDSATDVCTVDANNIGGQVANNGTFVTATVNFDGSYYMVVGTHADNTSPYEVVFSRQ